MNIEQLHQYCICKKGVAEHFPFDKVTLVLKVMDKMFAWVGLTKWENGEPSINLKCNPRKAIELRSQCESIISGYHMNKKHWNTLYINKEVDDSLIFELIDHSYDLVVKGLIKKQREVLNSL